MRTTNEGLKARVIEKAVKLFAAIVKLFPELWFRFTKKSNRYAAYFIPNLEKERKMLVKLQDSEIPKHLWSQELRLEFLDSVYHTMVFCEDIQNAAEFDALLKVAVREAIRKACMNKGYTLNRAQVIKVCNCWPRDCMEQLMRNQPGSFDVNVIKSLELDALHVFILYGSKYAVTTEVLEYLTTSIDLEAGQKQDYFLLLQNNLDKYPKNRKSLQFLKNFSGLYQTWMQNNTVRDIFDLCFEDWYGDKSEDQSFYINFLIQKALEKRDRHVLKSIAWRYQNSDEDRFYDIIRRMVLFEIPCSLLLSAAGFDKKHPELYAGAVKVSLVPNAVDEISPKVAATFEKSLWTQYVLVMAKAGKLSYEQYSKLDRELKSLVIGIQKDHADIAWLGEHPHLSVIDLKNKKFSAYVQMWMSKNFWRALELYIIEHELEVCVLKNIMNDADKRSFLVQYCQFHLFSPELREYLSFSPNKGLLPAI